MKSRWGIGVLLTLYCATGLNADIKARAIRLLWTQELEVVEAAAHAQCDVVDLGRVRAAAKALDTISKLHVTDEIHWEYVPLDRVEVESAIRRWSEWFEHNQKGLRMDIVVTTIESARSSDQSQIVP
jgi:hypothetical protein